MESEVDAMKGNLRKFRDLLREISCHRSMESLIRDMRAGDHICLIYDGDDEWRGAVVPFIVEGLRRGVDPVRRSLIRLGYDNMAGYLAGGFPSWYMAGLEIMKMRAISVHELREMEGDFFLLDVRKITDRDRFHIEGSEHIWVGDLPDNLDLIPEKDVVIYCDSGYKSTIAASILEGHGFNVTTVLGGIGAWLRAGYPVAGDV